MKAKINLLMSTLVLTGFLTYAATGTAPSITVSPLSQTVLSGTSVIFSVTATGTTLQYQWTYNGDIIPGATSPTLNLNNVSAQSCGAYQVIVFNDAGAVKSARATLQVVTPLLAFADNFANCGSISGVSG